MNDVMERIATALHYPEHWDTAAYPTLETVILEAVSDFACSECEVNFVNFGDERN
jgi:hypothetical protein